MLEAETGNAGGKQQGGVEIRATRELRLLKTSDGERLTLRGALVRASGAASARRLLRAAPVCGIHGEQRRFDLGIGRAGFLA